MDHDQIKIKLENSVTRDKFVELAYRYNLVCVATHTYFINVYLIPYDGGTTIIKRDDDGHITSSRVGAEVAQMLLDMGVNDDEIIDPTGKY